MLVAMQDIIGIVFFCVMFVGVPLFCFWVVIHSIRNGVVRARGASYKRTDNPKSFWMMVAVYAALGIWIGYLASLIGVDILRHP